MRHRGVTIPEVLVALVILTVGLLGLGASGLFVTGMVARGERAGTAATFAARRLELLRAGLCASASRAGGSEQLTRGSAVLAANTWSIADGGNGIIHLRVVSTYQLAPRRVRHDTLETAVLCP